MREMTVVAGLWGTIEHDSLEPEHLGHIMEVAVPFRLLVTQVLL